MTFAGPVTFSQPGAQPPTFDSTVTVTMSCAGDDCRIVWEPTGHLGEPPAWTRGDTRLRYSVPASGDPCSGEFGWGMSVDLRISPERITGTIHRDGFGPLACSETVTRIGHSASAQVDIPLVAGDPCLTSATAQCGAAEETTEEVPIALLVGVGLAVVVAGAGAAVVQAQRGRAVATQTTERLHDSAASQSAERQDVADNIDRDRPSAEPGSTPDSGGGAEPAQLSEVQQQLQQDSEALRQGQQAPDRSAQQQGNAVRNVPGT